MVKHLRIVGKNNTKRAVRVKQNSKVAARQLQNVLKLVIKGECCIRLPDLNASEIVWKSKKQPVRAQHICELLQDFVRLTERKPRVCKSCHQSKRRLL